MPKEAVSVALSHTLVTDGAFHALESKVRRPAKSCLSVPRWFRHPFPITAREAVGRTDVQAVEHRRRGLRDRVAVAPGGWSGPPNGEMGL